ncbi:MAG: hypothetical protein P1V97_33950, partial [Planctomycetota bacterium]|nr:hypothetical protein [Planctomycetota bacterium]
MTRKISLVTLSLGLILLGFSSEAPGTQGKDVDYFQARVKFKNREGELEGKARFKKGKFEIYENGRLKKYAPGDIEYFEELDEL